MQSAILKRIRSTLIVPVKDPIHEIEVIANNQVTPDSVVVINHILETVYDIQYKINATKSFDLPLRKQRELKAAMCYLRDNIETLDKLISNE